MKLNKTLGKHSGDESSQLGDQRGSFAGAKLSGPEANVGPVMGSVPSPPTRAGARFRGEGSRRAYN